MSISFTTNHHFLVYLILFTDNSDILREHNHGLGLEHIVRKDVAVTTGLFNNTLRKDTFYVGVAYTPLRVIGLHTGVVVGLDLSGGYNSISNKDIPSYTVSNF